MKKQVLFVILLFFGFAFLVYLFPFIFVEAAKLQSGVTIKAPTTTPPPAGTCPDTNGDGTPDVTGGECTSPTGPAAGTCGLQIVSGVPINYGQINLGLVSAEKQVVIKNEGIVPAKIMVKGGDWISDAAGNPTISGPEKTRVSWLPHSYFSYYMPLLSNGVELVEISGGQSRTVYFLVNTADFPSGSFHQEVSIDLLC